MPAFYRRSLSTFLDDSPDFIIGRLTQEEAGAGFFLHVHDQTAAWQEVIEILKACALSLISNFATSTMHLLLEYPIPRRGKRIDAVLIAGATIVVIEFKSHARHYDRAAIDQVEDYCLDLRDFHRESAGRTIVPMLVATQAPDVAEPIVETSGLVKPIWLVNARNAALKILNLASRFPLDGVTPINPHQWDNSDHSPTPSIIEAAQALYAEHNVRDITRCHGGVENLTRTTDAVIGAIEEARATNRKRICFITGVPGSGKTLAGLNIVHNRRLHEGHLGIFLSGNGPLVRVLTEALARDRRRRGQIGMRESRRKVGTFVQNVHHFIRDYYADFSKVPIDRVVVFDEAQRAWDAAQSARKFDRPFSEPEILLEIMNRHADWSVIVALVGSGQEINRGEAGLSEWGRALRERFPHWDVLVSPELKVGTHPTGPCLFPETPRAISISENESLHLKVNLRFYKAEVLSGFVDALLRMDTESARCLSNRLGDFRIVLTRDLSGMRAWLWRHRRGYRRVGLVASSGARRLRAHGLDVKAELEVEEWFLNDRDDVRSSNLLEVPATEFGIQGLELDWTGVCWGGDLYPERDRWVARQFRGNACQFVNDRQTHQYIINKYRVLLTRSREGMAIWVPPGNPEDTTRPPRIYDQVADYLASCGLQMAN
jgi:hypothetical protein